MKMTEYTNPMRGMERRLAPDFASREMRDPGLRSSGLGSLHHTMPHLRRMTTMRLAAGGSGDMTAASAARTFDPVGQLYSASRPNLYNPDPMFRKVRQAVAGIPMRSAMMSGAPFSGAGFSYDQGGEAQDPDAQDLEDQPTAPQDLMQPEDQQSSHDDQARQIVVEAMAALDGEHPDAKQALIRFIDMFGPQALADLQEMVESRHQANAQDDQEDEDDEEQEPEEEPDATAAQLTGAGGGLMNGPGTGQSDEIEGTTPSGRPVLLSDGEYVIDAPTVAALGDGSTSAGARRLDELRRQIRKDAYGHDKQAKPMRKGGAALLIKLR